MFSRELSSEKVVVDGGGGVENCVEEKNCGGVYRCRKKLKLNYRRVAAEDCKNRVLYVGGERSV